MLTIAVDHVTEQRGTALWCWVILWDERAAAAPLWSEAGEAFYKWCVTQAMMNGRSERGASAVFGGCGNKA